jgi:hypothetical protein
MRSYIVSQRHTNIELKMKNRLKKEKQTSVQLSVRWANGLLAKALKDRDYYSSITLEKILASAGIRELDDSELEELLKSKKEQKEEAIVETK